MYNGKEIRDEERQWAARLNKEDEKERDFDGRRRNLDSPPVNTRHEHTYGWSYALISSMFEERIAKAFESSLFGTK